VEIATRLQEGDQVRRAAYRRPMDPSTRRPGIASVVIERS
jgi:hypothetical protein